MNFNPRLSFAIAAILSGSSGFVHAAPAAPATPASDTETSSDMIQEITVTAQRRTENIQDVPISIRALTAETLTQLNVQTLDDYIKYLPNVTSASNGPGQNEVYMRGLAAGSQASQGSGSTGLWPNVAIYLDNQSGQLPNRNLDIYAADLNRIEVLEGPQGTLFGAGAEAGAIRYITNEPKLDVTEENVTAGYGVTSHGNPNSNVTAVLNLPLIADTMAVRGVIYNDTRGGYIDNVPATFTRKNTDIGIYYANYATGCATGTPSMGVCTGKGNSATAFGVPPGSPVINNASVVANDINPVTYQGMRLELLYKFNDNWNALLSQTYQDMTAQGVFYQQPNASDGAPLAPLEVTLFNNGYDDDKFESTALTVNGKFGDLKAVYSGGYLVRNVNQVNDYTNYARGLYADMYQCYGPGTGGDQTLKSTCFSPSATWRETEKNEHLQQEIRLSTPDDWRWRAIGGAYYEDNKLFDQTGWQYKTIPACTATDNSACLSNIGTAPGASVVNPGVQNSNTSFYQDQERELKQTAFFLSSDFDIIPQVLTVTAGTRHYEFENSLVGSVTGSFGCFEQGASATGCLAENYNLNAANLRDTESGFKSRANLTWHITPDAMVYYTWSQGFRPGGFNQNGGSEHAPGPNGVNQYLLESAYVSDSLTNNEVGWKTEWFNHRLQWNGAVYQENWNNVQVPFFDPGVVGNIFYNTNGQDFRIRGLETSMEARVLSGLTLRGAAAWNHSEQTNSPALIDNNPADNIPGGNYGNPITQKCVVNATPPPATTSCSGITSPYGNIGSPSANAPPIQFSLHARYEWSLNGYTPFVQAGANHSGHSFTQAGANPTYAVGGAVQSSRGRFENPAYSTYDASLGIAKDAWYVTLYGENISNSNASTFISTDQFIVAQTPLRPRVIGGTFGYKF
jgi:outer membrane receptor protein involved in Fe transport